MPLGATISSESIEEDEHHVYQTLFEDHPKGEGIFVILNIRVERAEVPWSDLRFESKLGVTNLIYMVKKILVIPGVSIRMLKVGLKKALDYSQFYQ